MEAATPADGAAGSDAASTPAIRYVGRFDTSHPDAPQVDWSDARVLVRFAGTEATVTMTDTSYGGGNAYWDVTIDGILAPLPLALAEGQASYPLTEGLVSGVHTIELWKRTEANVSLTAIDGFSFGDGTLLPPAPAPSRRIEFLGDSVSAGFGDLGTDPSCVFSPATENSHLAFPALVATAFGADHQNLAYSGFGIYWSYDRAGPVFSSLYPLTLATAPGSTWSFASFEPDVVWVTLGGNDWDQPDPGDPPPSLSAFEGAYDSLVETVRAQHPNAYIVCAIAPSLNDSYPSAPPYDALTNMETALAWEVAQHPTDHKLAYFEFARATSAELSGCGSHPGVAEQSSLAQQAITVIASFMGWTAE
jgi:lysophospholipase L1-like esterase